MIRERHRTFAIVVAALIAGAGCTSAPKPAPPPPPPAAWTPPATRAESTAQLEPVADQFGQQVAQMPGTDGTDHRERAADALGTLSRVLQLVNGPDESPSFANRLNVVKAARETIADPTIPRERLEAAENQALVAAVDALDEVSTRYLFDDEKLPDLVKTARDKVNAALQSQGPMHDVDASTAFTAVDALVRAETDAFIDRFGSFEARTRLAQRMGTPLPVAPTPPPASAPTTAPGATEPAMPTPASPATAPA
jgi:hypothetical protein